MCSRSHTLSVAERLDAKSIGKSLKVYWPQQHDSDMTPAEKSDVERKIAKYREDLRLVQAENDSLKKECLSIDRAPTEDVLDTRIPQLEAELNHLKKVQGEAMSKRSGMDPKKVSALTNKVKKLFKEWRKRHDACMEAVGSILENISKKQAQLLEEIGIIPDEVRRHWLMS